MDYIILSALLGVTLLHVVITYDIACQWSKNLEKRMKNMPQELQVNLSELKITAAVPSWHINAHGARCQTDFALAYRTGTCHTCGEEIESSWGSTNVLGSQVREQAPGVRHDGLNDHWNGSNFQKKIGLRECSMVFPNHSAMSHFCELCGCRYSSSKTAVRGSEDEPSAPGVV